GSGFRKHRHMMDARKLLINLLYPASAQSSEVPGWSHREIKNGARQNVSCATSSTAGKDQAGLKPQAAPKPLPTACRP
ncbi:MAG: hypothetical protein KGI86_05155, partial [Betaproteobacteria bacterium]|nr:hypothetical protein [Betaproteobacteria bacterium]